MTITTEFGTPVTESEAVPTNYRLATAFEKAVVNPRDMSVFDELLALTQANIENLGATSHRAAEYHMRQSGRGLTSSLTVFIGDESEDLPVDNGDSHYWFSTRGDTFPIGVSPYPKTGVIGFKLDTGRANHLFPHDTRDWGRLVLLTPMSSMPSVRARHFQPWRVLMPDLEKLIIEVDQRQGMYINTSLVNARTGYAAGYTQVNKPLTGSTLIERGSEFGVEDTRYLNDPVTVLRYYCASALRLLRNLEDNLKPKPT